MNNSNNSISPANAVVGNHVRSLTIQDCYNSCLNCCNQRSSLSKMSGSIKETLIFLNSASTLAKSHITELESNHCGVTDNRTAPIHILSQIESFIRISINHLNACIKAVNANTSPTQNIPRLSALSLSGSQFEPEPVVDTKPQETLQNELSTLRAKNAELEFELQDLRNNYEALSSDVETLSEELFSTANRMVAEEARIRAEIASENVLLDGRLKSLLQKMQERESELDNLKTRLSNAGGSRLGGSLNKLFEIFNDDSTTTTTTTATNQNSSSVHCYISANEFLAFQDYLKSISLLKDPFSSSIPFFKDMLISEVEPLFAKFSVISSALRKRLLNAFKSENSLRSTNLSETATNTKKHNCVLCGDEQKNSFQFHDIVFGSLHHLGEVDGICRDRLFALYDFFNFIKELKKGTVQLPLLTLYKLLCIYRVRLNMARIGAIKLLGTNGNYSNAIIL